jgi:hypothetical protein
MMVYVDVQRERKEKRKEERGRNGRRAAVFIGRKRSRRIGRFLSASRRATAATTPASSQQRKLRRGFRAKCVLSRSSFGAEGMPALAATATHPSPER